MDEIAAYNRSRWDRLARAGALFTRPWLDLTADRARRLVDPHDLLGPLDNTDVLCIASGGGQQAVAFALAGARVTSIDISPEQVRRDRETAARYAVALRCEEGDMRDLGRFVSGSFDVVHHSYSINFVPDPVPVFQQVARVLRPSGVYQLFLANPFGLGLAHSDWRGDGYLLRHPYIQGSVVRSDNPAWFFRDDPPAEPIDGPVEYCHTLSTVVNGLARSGFAVVHLSEVGYGRPDPSAEPASWEHLSAYMPWWLDLAARPLGD